MQPLLQLASEVDSDDEIERMQLEQMNESSSATPRAPPPMPQQGPSQQQLKDTATWLKIYPVYFDSLKSKAEGRRIPKEYAFPDPSSIYIIEAIQRLNLQVIYENEKVFLASTLTLASSTRSASFRSMSSKRRTVEME
jgi:signal recognition particle subunit SEC65